MALVMALTNTDKSDIRMRRDMNEKDHDISRLLQALAAEINEILESATGEPTGFSLLVFQKEDNGTTNYVSNCAREEVAAAMRDLLKTWEGGFPGIPAHKLN